MPQALAADKPVYLPVQSALVSVDVSGMQMTGTWPACLLSSTRIISLSLGKQFGRHAILSALVTLSPAETGGALAVASCPPMLHSHVPSEACMLLFSRRGCVSCDGDAAAACLARGR